MCQWLLRFVLVIGTLSNGLALNFQYLGIAHRWNSPNPQDFSYRLYTKDQLLTMSQAQIRQLSPAEKYDIYVRT